jgi:hypothetical protein
MMFFSQDFRNAQNYVFISPSRHLYDVRAKSGIEEKYHHYLGLLISSYRFERRLQQHFELNFILFIFFR